MIISPPRLIPPKNKEETIEKWIEKIMPNNARGGFPVGYYGQWHTGLHISELSGTSENGGIGIWAIADGIVMISQNSGDIQPAADSEGDANSTYARRDSTGVVVLRHETEIGEGDDGKIIFYSVYHHLGIISPQAQSTGKLIHRKDLIGYCGQVAGSGGIHCEIFCTEDNLKKIIGRIHGGLDTTRNGRKHIVYGAIHFIVPASTKCYTFPNNQPPLNNGVPENGKDIGIELYIKIEFEKGQANIETRIKDANKFKLIIPNKNERNHIGMSEDSSQSKKKRGRSFKFEYKDYEYNLYLLAEALAKNHSSTSISSIYELLRYGRLINTDRETPIHPEIPHWHLIDMPNGDQKWVNLHQSKIKVFSDGDFPHWMGWTIVDGTADGSSLCSNKDILNIIFKGNETPTAINLRKALSDKDTKQKLNKIICKRPSEWNENTIKKRETWRTIKSEINLAPIDQKTFNGNYFLDYKKLCFWNRLHNNNTHFPNGQLSIGNDKDKYLGKLENDVYFFNPAEFINHFSKCLWLAPHEMQKASPQSLPENIVKFNASLNKIARKYLISNNKIRLSLFIGQSIHESANLSGQMIEIGNTKASRVFESDSYYFTGPDDYFDQYNGKLDNTMPGDGIKFRGRGLVQLTGKANYVPYWIYRHWIPNSSIEITNPQMISGRASGDQYNPCDASGWYWTKRSIIYLAKKISKKSGKFVMAALPAGFININKVIDHPELVNCNFSIHDKVSMQINPYDGPTFPTRSKCMTIASKVITDEI